MGLFRMVALGAAGVVAYKFWKQRQAGSETRRGQIDHGDVTPPHGDALLGNASVGATSDPVIAAAQSSRGFGGP